MALKISKNVGLTDVVSDTNPITTTHPTSGSTQEVSLWLFNDDSTKKYESINIDPTDIVTTDESSWIQLAPDSSGVAGTYGAASVALTMVNLTNVANPTAAPTLTTATTGGSLAAATYYVVYSWSNANGETLLSPEASIATAGTTSTVTVTLPALPAGATSSNVYIGTATGTGTRQGNTTTSYVQSAVLSAGAARPTASTANGARFWMKATTPSGQTVQNKTDIKLTVNYTEFAV